MGVEDDITRFIANLYVWVNNIKHVNTPQTSQSLDIKKNKQNKKKGHLSSFLGKLRNKKQEKKELDHSNISKSQILDEEDQPQQSQSQQQSQKPQQSQSQQLQQQQQQQNINQEKLIQINTPDKISPKSPYHDYLFRVMSYQSNSYQKEPSFLNSGPQKQSQRSQDKKRRRRKIFANTSSKNQNVSFSLQRAETETQSKNKIINIKLTKSSTQLADSQFFLDSPNEDRIRKMHQEELRKEIANRKKSFGENQTEKQVPIFNIDLIEENQENQEIQTQVNYQKKNLLQSKEIILQEILSQKMKQYIINRTLNEIEIFHESLQLSPIITDSIENISMYSDNSIDPNLVSLFQEFENLHLLSIEKFSYFETQILQILNYIIVGINSPNKEPIQSQIIDHLRNQRDKDQQKTLENLIKSLEKIFEKSQNPPDLIKETIVQIKRVLIEDDIFESNLSTIHSEVRKILSGLNIISNQKFKVTTLEKFRVFCLIDLYSVKTIFKNILSEEIERELVSRKLILNSMYADIRTTIFHSLDKVISGFSDFKRIKIILENLFSLFEMKDSKEIAKKIVKYATKMSLGKSIRLIMNRELNTNLKKRIKELIQESNENEDEIDKEIRKEGKKLLSKYLRENDINLLIGIIHRSNCGDSIENLSRHLFHLFEVFKMSIPFLLLAISQQILKATTPIDLFESNDSASSLLSIFSHFYANNFLRQLFGEKVKQLSDSNLELPIDHNSYNEGWKDADELRLFVSNFLHLIFKSTSSVPRIIKLISYYIYNKAKEQFESYETQIVLSYLFTHFYAVSFRNFKLYPISEDSIQENSYRILAFIGATISSLSRDMTFSSGRSSFKLLSKDISKYSSRKSSFLRKIFNDIKYINEQEILDLQSLNLISNNPLKDFVYPLYSDKDTKSLSNFLYGSLEPFLSKKNSDFFTQTSVYRLTQFKQDMENCLINMNNFGDLLEFIYKWLTKLKKEKKEEEKNTKLVQIEHDSLTKDTVKHQENIVQTIDLLEEFRNYKEIPTEMEGQFGVALKIKGKKKIPKKRNLILKRNLIAVFRSIPNSDTIPNDIILLDPNCIIKKIKNKTISIQNCFTLSSPQTTELNLFIFFNNKETSEKWFQLLIKAQQL
ncbi:camk family protein kinase [Anaeramoeba ignava]|uniref:Camk family protein kinase n=1 Tax=Anaeramoeba ignava TaxID=1746090 RepID=A0A9Q0RDW5_ANAIG|nr:camk family protein kinase [Anaeramoeba ignava]